MMRTGMNLADQSKRIGLERGYGVYRVALGDLCCYFCGKPATCLIDSGGYDTEWMPYCNACGEERRLELQPLATMEYRCFTFGHGQPNFPGYVHVYGIDEAHCRQRMIAAYGTQWSMMYRSVSEVHPTDRRLVATIGRPGEVVE